jgi:drug/metabolite transporter (DMT)-like permease
VAALSIAAIFAFRRIDIITGISAVAAFIGYAGIMLAVWRDARRGISPDKHTAQRAALAGLWSVAVVAALTLPETDMPGSDFHHWPAATTLAAAAIGTILWRTHVRRKVREGRAGPPDTRNTHT